MAWFNFCRCHKPLQRASCRQCGQLMLEPWYPLFPLLKSGLQGRGPKAVQGLLKVELGLAQQVGVVLAGQEFGEASGFFEEGSLQELKETVGLFLLGGDEVHGG
jgi:hypothetical protein